MLPVDGELAKGGKKYEKIGNSGLTVISSCANPNCVSYN